MFKNSFWAPRKILRAHLGWCSLVCSPDLIFPFLTESLPEFMFSSNIARKPKDFSPQASSFRSESFASKLMFLPLCSEAASCCNRPLPPAAPGSPCSCTQKCQSANIGQVEENKKRPDHLTSLEKLLQPPTTDPVLVAHGDRGEGERVLVVDRGGDVHRPGKELLGQAHLK